MVSVRAVKAVAVAVSVAGAMLAASPQASADAVEISPYAFVYQNASGVLMGFESDYGVLNVNAALAPGTNDLQMRRLRSAVRLTGGPGGSLPLRRSRGFCSVTMTPDPACPDTGFRRCLNVAFMIPEPGQRISLTRFRDHDTMPLSLF